MENCWINSWFISVFLALQTSRFCFLIKQFFVQITETSKDFLLLINAMAEEKFSELIESCFSGRGRQTTLITDLTLLQQSFPCVFNDRFVGGNESEINEKLFESFLRAWASVYLSSGIIIKVSHAAFTLIINNELSTDSKHRNLHSAFSFDPFSVNASASIIKSLFYVSFISNRWK